MNNYVEQQNPVLQTERWSFVELEVPAEVIDKVESGVSGLKVVFTQEERRVETEPFCDSTGRWRIRFMPEEEGAWQYETIRVLPSGRQESVTAGISGSLQCSAASPMNHGPVRTVDERRFGYADGTPFIPFGTTAQAAWQKNYAEPTLSVLAAAPFNKIRVYADVQSLELEELDAWIGRLQKLGMEAELVLQCASADAGTAGRLRQAVSRLSAYRNVWWSLAVPEEREDLLEDLLTVIWMADPYRHPLTCFSANPLKRYGDHRISHVSLQAMDPSQTSQFTKLHRKPVIVDECGCEGNGPTLWGSLPGEELLHRVWESLCRGGYAGHGEMLLSAEKERSWHSHGEVLQGEAVSRIAFLSAIAAQAPDGLEYMPEFYDAATIGLEGHYYLQYFGIHRYPSKSLQVPEGRYAVDLIDTWNQTIKPLKEAAGPRIDISLPGLTGQAVRVRRLDGGPAPERRAKDAEALQRQAEDNDNFIDEAARIR